MKKLLAALFAGMFALGTVSAFAADDMKKKDEAKKDAPKKKDEMKKDK
jgi:pentapeptide MXKDX repeat protein